ncbi:uncharacterized protein LOC125431295 [Sphaerodactylus townsendi]|uniref:uncharacterized protein LOC125431295 n=1 Tax=Sphaerodactylus townsendi TaxID=933632 RepID=UPI0020274836|nr:uncharacterized protein LOC125431295 [Sphaerodactylus townsendi]
MSAPRRGVYWQAEEVTILLRTIRDCGHAWLLMASTGLPNRRAFRAVARALQVAGFHRTEVQACTKWKALKRDFFAAMERSGGHPRRSDWPPHFAAMRQLWRLAGEPRWVDRRPEGAAARRRALAPPREPLDEAAEGPGGDSSDASSVAPAERAGGPAQPLHSSSTSSMEAAAGHPPAHGMPTQDAGSSGLATVPQLPSHPQCHCNRMWARMERRLFTMERRLSALERRHGAEGHPQQTTMEPPLILSSGTASATQHPGTSSASSSSPRLMLDLEAASTLAASPPSSAPGALPEAPEWGGPAPHLAGLPSSSEDTP